MKIALLTNIVSPHQLPLAEAIVRIIGEKNYAYVYTEKPHDERTNMGWGRDGKYAWCRFGTEEEPELLDADVVVSGNRALRLFERRNALGKKTYYTSERWLKPPLGAFKLLHPKFLRMVVRFVKCLKSEAFMILPIGVHAARDFVRLMGLFRGDLRCLFRTPKVAFESRPGGVILPLDDAIKAEVLSQMEIAFGERNGFVQIPEKHWGKIKPSGVYAKMRMWGYFVKPGERGIKNCELRIKNGAECRNSEGVVKSDKELDKRDTINDAFPIQHTTKLLWVGRMLNCKRVDVLVRAARPHPDCKRVDVSLNIYGKGETEADAKRLADGADNISFHDFVPISEVRKLMRGHDVYVLSSDGYEGWGAVVSEALEEGMKVIGTVEAGSTATILPPGNLFKAEDVDGLRTLLQGDISDVGIGTWTAEYAAKTLTETLVEG